MKITNRLGLPAPLVKAVSLTRHEPDPTPNTIRVSELIQPPQLRALVKKYEAELVEDASDRIWSLLGTLLHDILEKNAKGLDNHITEEELSIEVSGYKVIGHYDLSELVLDGEVLTDWKLTSIYALKEREEVKPEWEAQINVYAELLRRAGRTVSKGQIIAIGRDWSKSRAMREKDYPQQQVLIKPVSMWSAERIDLYLNERVVLHHDAVTLGQWPDCTPEERWAKPDIWALHKKGQKKAVKLFYNPADAEGWLDQILGGQKNYFIDHREGESTRCAGYCPVSSKCAQWAKLNNKLSDTLKESIKVAQQLKETK